MLLDDGFEEFQTSLTRPSPKSVKLSPSRENGLPFGTSMISATIGNTKFYVRRLSSGRQRTVSALCVEGERNCPPEDVGGVWGYAEYLESLADPKHERHEAHAADGVVPLIPKSLMRKRQASG